MSDEITLTIPRERDFLSVAHLVLGGVGVRLNLTYEVLEDLQLALDAILERDREPGDVTIALRVGMNTIEAEVGPLRDGALSWPARAARRSACAGSSTRSLTASAVETRTEPPAKAAQGGRGGQA